MANGSNTDLQETNRVVIRRKLGLTVIFPDQMHLAMVRTFFAPEPSSIAYYAWIDNYCTQHPLDTLMLAAFKLKRELASRAPAG